ncbi:MAG TPA: Gfo/Idh/MocA family oxidoreductase [Casimicrobiaceae bacterium]|jgi:myo-inositol 2-dehydrogenase/D-chiro-inositol 1-dehydrogenase
MSAPHRLRIGIAGLGRLGRRHAENLAQRTPRAQLVAACSPVAEELAWAEQRLGIARGYRDYAAMLADPEVDAVFLVTPTTLHAAQIIEAIDAGKHVFCEKPLSLEIADCERVQRAATRRPGLKVMIGYARRFDPSYRDAYDKIQAGAIGSPFLVRSQNLDMNDPSGFFVRFAPTSGGIFLDCTVHDIDLARWFLGSPRPLRVFAAGTVAIHQGLREFGDVDNGVATCEFDGGKLACFYASRTMAHGHETATEIFGTAGRLAIGANPRLNRVDISDAHGVRNECTPTFYERFEAAFLLELAHFVDAVLDDHPPALTLHDATEATRIALALRESLQQRKVIELA